MAEVDKKAFAIVSGLFAAAGWPYMRRMDSLTPNPSVQTAPLVREWTTLEISAHPDAIVRAVTRLRNHLAALGAPESALETLQLAVTEALSNSFKHGRTVPDAEPVTLAWNWTGEWLELAVSEPGFFEPPQSWTALPPELESEGGRGGFLIREAVDEVKHENHGGRHTLRLRKRLGAEAAQGREEQAQETLDAMTAELSDTYESLAVLFGLGEALAMASTLSQFLNSVLAKLHERVSFDTGFVRLADASRELEVLNREVLGETGIPERISADADAIEARVYRQRHEVTLVSRGTLAKHDPLWRPMGSLFVCPVSFRGKAVGVFTVGRNGGSDYFTAGQLGLLRMVADFVGIAHATAELQKQQRELERTVRELEIARMIQQSLLPKTFPDRSDWQVFGLCRNATVVGGDFFDVREIPDRGLLLVIADVMGKGLPAALLATVLRTAIRGRPDLADKPGELLTAVNRELAGDLQPLDIFITAQVAFLPSRGGDVFYASAGHGPMLALGPGDDKVELLASGGLPLGIRAGEIYETGSHHGAPGLRLLMMTDGIYEAESGAGDQVGIQHVADIMSEAWTQGPSVFCEHLLKTVQSRDAGPALGDDCTLLAAELLR